MKKLFIVANWKCNKTVGEAEEWIKQFSIFNFQFSMNLEVILCAPFSLLYPLDFKFQISNFKFKLGAQDVSPFPDGAYTGEVSGRMLKNLGVEYVIIGHSERRKYFKENEQMLTNKVKEVLDVGVIPIYCLQDKKTPVPQGVNIVAYEPVFAIGSGIPDSPKNADEVGRIIKERLGKETIFLYGGSVSAENVTDFCCQENINGVLVGGASLEVKKFLEIIKNASQI